MTSRLYWSTLGVLCILFVIASAAYLHRVPGLLGDEGSEGENVFELLDKKEITVVGERSYIGPAIDYLRVPFILTIGYNALALRTLMLLFSIATFWLAAIVFRRLFGEQLSLFALAFLFFSPQFLLYERLGWAITLYPFFTFLILFFLTSRAKHAPLLAGVSGGLGLANHIVFLPTLVGIAAAWLPRFVVKWKELKKWWPALIGFWAGFGMQFAVLALFREDQGDPGAVAEVASERWHALPGLLRVVLSGSSYVARYTGVEFSASQSTAISLAVCALAVFGVLLLIVRAFLPLAAEADANKTHMERRRAALAAGAWAAGLVVYLIALMYVIDRFTLRYFWTFSLGVWALAGLGVGVIVVLLWRRLTQWIAAVPVAAAILLTLWMTAVVLIPFLRTGGSTRDFLLGNRTDSAAAFVDARPLIACLRGAGPVSSEAVHIWNRLEYVSHSLPDLDVLPEEQLSDAQWLVHYRLASDDRGPGDLCPQLTHFHIQRVTE